MAKANENKNASTETKEEKKTPAKKAKMLRALKEVQYLDEDKNQIIVVKPGSLFLPKDRELEGRKETLIQNMIRRKSAAWATGNDDVQNLSAVAALADGNTDGPNADDPGANSGPPTGAAAP